MLHVTSGYTGNLVVFPILTGEGIKKIGKIHFR